MKGTARLIAVLACLALFGCAGKESKSMKPWLKMAPCPATPNCVSSDARDSTHAIEPFRLTTDPETAWRVAREALASMPGTTIVDSSADWIHAEAKTRIFRFTDDVELELRAADGIIAVRSASRIGRSDLGVNRKRVERLRALLRARGVVR